MLFAKFYNLRLISTEAILSHIRDARIENLLNRAAYRPGAGNLGADHFACANAARTLRGAAPDGDDRQGNGACLSNGRLAQDITHSDDTNACTNSRSHGMAVQRQLRSSLWSV